MSETSNWSVEEAQLAYDIALRERHSAASGWAGQQCAENTIGVALNRLKIAHLQKENAVLRAKLANCVDAIDARKREVANLKYWEADGK